MVFKKSVGIAVLVALAIQPAMARSKLEPERYHFTYEYKDDRIINSSVCNQYNRSSTDWIKCRLYAKWWFGQKCTNDRAKVRHMKPETYEYRKWKMYCAAEQDINAGR